MHTTNGWEIPQRGDKFNPEGRDWAVRLEEFMTAYASIINKTSGKIVLSTSSPSTDAIRVPGTSADVVVIDTIRNTMAMPSLSASRVVVTDHEHRLVPAEVSVTEVEQLRGIRVNIQTQLDMQDARIESISGSFGDRGDVSAVGPITVIGGSQAALGSGVQISFAKATTSTDGFLTSADWSTFNNKIGSIPSLTSADISASSSVIKIVGGAKAALGTGVQISATQATATMNGFLTSADWSTFNNKIGSIPSLTSADISASTSVIKIVGGSKAALGTGVQISATQATSSMNGFLTSADWSTFNNKLGSVPSLTSADISASTSVIKIVGGAKAALGTGVQISATQATASTDGFLSSADWVTFNNKLTSVPSLTSADISASTSVIKIVGGSKAALGTGVQISATQATATMNGFLTSADWTTFNNKLDSVPSLTLSDMSASTPVIQVVGGTKATLGTGVQISATQATATMNGFLTSADWTTFNNKLTAVPSLTSADISASSSVIQVVGGTKAALGTGVQISATQASGSMNGFLTSADWTTFNNKLTTVPSLTSADISASSSVIKIVGGSKAALGTGVQISATQATATMNGFLTSADWITFNNKIGSIPSLTSADISASTPVIQVVGGTKAALGTGVQISATQASSSMNGFLTSADWITFNNKIGSIPSLTSADISASSSVIQVVGGTKATLGTGVQISATQASSSMNGFLTSADWVVFNNKVSSIPSLTSADISASSSVIQVVGGTKATLGTGVQISATQASSSMNGFLTSADWVVFNNKVGPSVSYSQWNPTVSANAPTTSVQWDTTEYDTMSVDLSAATGAVTVVLKNIVVGGKYQMRVRQHRSVARTITLSATGYTVKTPGGAGYSISTALGAIDLISMSVVVPSEVLVVNNKVFS